MKHLLSLTMLFLLLSSTSLLSQSSKKNKMSKADKAFMMQNYYEAEINYQDQIDKEKSTLALEREVLQFDAENQSLFLDLPVGATGILHLFRPSDSKLDQKLTVEIKEENEKTVSIRNLQAGYWKAQLSWQENGESYYQEKKISLK